MQSERWVEAVWKTGAAPDGTWIVLRGSSMEPAYADGDNLLVKPLHRARNLRTGDVVVVRRSRNSFKRNMRIAGASRSFEQRVGAKISPGQT